MYQQYSGASESEKLRVKPPPGSSAAPPLSVLLSSAEDVCSQRRPGVRRPLHPPAQPPGWQLVLLQQDVVLGAGLALPGPGGPAVQGPSERRGEGAREEEEAPQTEPHREPRVWRPSSPRPEQVREEEHAPSSQVRLQQLHLSSCPLRV